MQASPEFKLAVECCRGSFAGPRPDAAARQSNEVDWRRFIELVHFHRIEGLAWNCLSNNDSLLPAAVRKELSDAATEIAADSLRAAAECAALRDSFAAEGIALLFLKGLPLGSLAYGNPAIKAAIDIDLLVDPGNLAGAAECLRRRGYRQIIPGTNRSLRAWHLRSKESVWARRDPPFQIDLHTRTADNPRLIPEINAHSPSQPVEMGPGLCVSTLADDELFAYLSVHGASSAWFRLKWIADFAGFLNSKRPHEIEQLYRRSQELGAGRSAGQGLLLADRLFGSLSQNAAFRGELGCDRVTRLLTKLAMAFLTRSPSEPTERVLGTLPLHLAAFLLMPGWRYKLSELSGQGGKLLDRLANG